MARSMEKYSQLDQEKRTVLLSLLTQDPSADPSAWQLFWQEVLGDDASADGEDLKTLVLVFDATSSSGLVRYKCKRTILLLEDVIRDFQRRMEKAELDTDAPHFSDEELEELLGP